MIECATFLAKGCTNIPLEARTRMMGELLAAAQPKVDYRPMLDANSVMDNEDMFEVLELYIKGCIIAQRNDLLGIAWLRLNDFLGLSNWEISCHVEYTLLPLISSIAEVAPDACSSEVSALCEAAVSHWLDTWADPEVHQLSTNLVCLMVDATIATQQRCLLDARFVLTFRHVWDGADASHVQYHPQDRSGRHRSATPHVALRVAWEAVSSWSCLRHHYAIAPQEMDHNHATTTQLPGEHKLPR